jgi:HD-GYP domain-containing protein (c-di-GMP phosphodiesterase class II)
MPDTLVLDKLKADYREENSELYKEQRFREGDLEFYEKDIQVLRRKPHGIDFSVKDIFYHSQNDLKDLIYSGLDLGPALKKDLENFKKEFPNLYPKSVHVGLLCYILGKRSERFSDEELPELYKGGLVYELPMQKLKEMVWMGGFSHNERKHLRKVLRNYEYPAEYELSGTVLRTVDAYHMENFQFEEAKILDLVDTFEAMLSKRHYRDPQKHDVKFALYEINKEKKFDEFWVKLLIGLVQEVIDLK